MSMIRKAGTTVRPSIIRSVAMPLRTFSIGIEGSKGAGARSSVRVNMYSTSGHEGASCNTR